MYMSELSVDPNSYENICWIIVLSSQRHLEMTRVFVVIRHFVVVSLHVVCSQLEQSILIHIHMPNVRSDNWEDQYDFVY